MLQCFSIAIVVLSPLTMAASPADVLFSSAPAQVDRFDYVEITATIQAPDVRNPFTDATLTGTLETADGSRQWNVEGFADSDNGAVYRIRFMPIVAGDYKYTVTYRQGDFRKTAGGSFHSIEAHRRGMLGGDPAYPWHFIWTGTGEHFFFNGTTAYWVVGWKEERITNFSIERLHRLKVNRMRVAIDGREATFFGEPVMNGPSWSVMLAPWKAENADDFSHPGWDYTRFNVSFWQRYDRMLKFARERDMNISLVLQMNDSYVHPVAGGEDEHRFIRYAAARFGAFSNITWDLGDDLERFRDDKWTHETGTLLQGCNWRPAIP
jgi:hypothetical protein